MSSHISLSLSFSGALWCHLRTLRRHLCDSFRNTYSTFEHAPIDAIVTHMRCTMFIRHVIYIEHTYTHTPIFKKRANLYTYTSTRCTQTEYSCHPHHMPCCIIIVTAPKTLWPPFARHPHRQPRQLNGGMITCTRTTIRPFPHTMLFAALCTSKAKVRVSSTIIESRHISQTRTPRRRTVTTNMYTRWERTQMRVAQAETVPFSLSQCRRYITNIFA